MMSPRCVLLVVLAFGSCAVAPVEHRARQATHDVDAFTDADMAAIAAQTIVADRSPPGCEAIKPSFLSVKAASVTEDAALVHPAAIHPGDFSGVVILTIEITAEGQIRCAEVWQSSGHPQLDAAALAGVSAGTAARAARVGAEAVDSKLRYKFRFVVE